VKLPITRNILSTIIYYDILNYPLTAFELWQYLTVPGGDATEKDECVLGDVIEALNGEEIKKYIEEFRGFYFLKGRKNLVARRIQNDKNSIAKFKIAGRVAWWLRLVPFVRMIAVTGTLAMKNPEIGSDIDFFVVLEKGRIFTGRLLVTTMVHILGKRRYGKNIKNRICLNYFITTGSFEIQRQDLFGANEYSFIYPILDSPVIPTEAKWSGGIYKNKAVASHQVIHKDPSTALGMTKNSVFCQFCQANAGWINKFKPNWEVPEIGPAKYYAEHSGIGRFIQEAKETLINFLGGDIMEVWLKKKQIARIERNPLTKKEGAYVEATDDNLIFLPEPQGMKIFEEYKSKSKEMYLPGVAYDESFS
jgi:hypothetical protein